MPARPVTRWALAGLPLLLAAAGLLIGGLSHVILAAEAAASIERDFATTAGERVAFLREALQVQVERLRLIRGFMEAEPSLTAAAFSRAVGPTVANDPALRALEWAPRVGHDVRAGYERLSGTRITQRGPNGQVRPAAARSVFYPVHFIEPTAGNEPAIGFDLASEARRRRAIDAAIQSDALVASAPIELVQSGGRERAILLVGAVGRRSQEARGVAVAVVELAPLFDPPSRRLGDNLGVRVQARDPGAGPGRQQIYRSPALDDDASAVTIHSQLDVAGRTWHLMLSPSPDWLAAHQPGRPWLLPIVIFALTLLIAVAFWRVRLQAAQRRAAEHAVRMLNLTLEDQVARRTAEARNEHAAVVRTQQKLLDQARQLQQAQKMEAFGQLAGGIAHDFNNMLVAIIGTAELALAELDDAGPSELRDDLGEINRIGHRAADLTRQLLAFSRQQILEPQVVALGAIIEDVARLSTRVLDANIGVEVETDDAQPCAMIDPTQLEQVLVNLILNARDAMPDGGTIRLGVRTESVEAGPPAGDGSSPATLTPAVAEQHGLGPGPYCLIDVEDTGVGMAPEVVERIFEPFFTTKGVGQGTGLGLSTCLGIITQSGGRILLESTPGAGSRFTVVLPRLGDAPPEAPARPADPVVGGTETILIVEDEEPVRALSTRVLRASGYAVIEAGDAVEASAAIAGRSVDLLLTDMTLPGINGIALATGLGAERPELRTLLMSGHAMREVADGGLTLPFLPKPFGPGELLRAVRSVLDGPLSDDPPNPPRAG